MPIGMPNVTNARGPGAPGFQGRFKGELIEDSTYFWTLAR